MRKRLFSVSLLVALIVVSVQGQRAAVLRDVKKIQVMPTVVPKLETVKEDFAPNLVQDSLRNALKDSNFELADDAPVKAHIVLEEFSSGSTAKRVMVGFGSGRSSVAGRLVFRDAENKEIANVPIKVRGNLLWNGYQGNNTQRRQATSSFEQKLIEEIARLK